MIHIIVEETWSTPTGNVQGQRLGPARMIDHKPSREEAELAAQALATKFRRYGFGFNVEGDGERSYWWGRDENGHEVHRFIVRPATP